MTNTIDPSLYLSNYQTQKTTGSNVLGKDDFLKILMVQLQNQDPTSPMEDREFIAQMAQFSSLEAMTNMSSTMQQFVDSQNTNLLISYNQFIGKEVNWHKLNYSTEDPNAQPEVLEGKGKVESVQFKDGTVQLILEDGTILEPANISGVSGSSSGSADSSLVQASMLIGKMVTYLNESQEELTAIVKSVSIKDGKTLFQLDDENQTSITAQQMTKIG